MSKDLNLCQFIGRLGSDPEIRFTSSGSATANMSIACSDDYKDKQGNKVEQTNWIKVVAFGRLAEIIQEYVKKGSQVYISGKQITRKWQAQDGTDRYTTEIVASELQMLGGRAQSNDSQMTNANDGGAYSHSQANGPASNQGSAATPQAAPEQFDDSIPF